MSSARAIATVWQRYFAVFKKNIWYGIITTFVEPLLYLVSFGFGLGAVVGDIDVGGHAVSYRSFVLAGLVGQTILFISFFDGAYGGFVRMYYQKIFQAIAVTPVTLSEVLWGELLWCSSRALLSTAVVLAIGVAIGDFHWLGALGVLPFALIASLMFSALGMLVAALSRTIESINYPQYLFVFPMFLFCGVYFPLTNLPKMVQAAAKILPLTPILSLSRSLTLGFPLENWSIALLALWTAVLVPWARRAMMNRLLA